MRDARIIWNYIERIATALKGADELFAVALEDFYDGAGIGFFVAGPMVSDIAADEDAIFVESCAGRICGDGDLLQARVFRLEEASAGTGHADATGNKVHLSCEGVMITFYPDDAAGVLQVLE
jgi:hypothetical protein